MSETTRNIAQTPEQTETPEQTIGPFFGYSLPYDGGEDIVDRARTGAMRLHGTLFDGLGTGAGPLCWDDYKLTPTYAHWESVGQA